PSASRSPSTGTSGTSSPAVSVTTSASWRPSSPPRASARSPDMDTMTAAADSTGIMLALIPTDDDTARLVVDGGEPATEIHLTLGFYGDTDDMPDGAADDLDRVAAEVAAGFDGPVTGEAFAPAFFNPNGDHPCWVLIVGGADLDAVHDAAEEHRPSWAP